MSQDSLKSASEELFVATPTLRAGVVRVDANLQRFSFPAHSHDHVCLGLMHRGTYSSRYGLRRYYPSAGDVIVVNAGEMHSPAALVSTCCCLQADWWLR
jgi:anti-sigma factor ChrR (cupin superfamily)